MITVCQMFCLLALTLIIVFVPWGERGGEWGGGGEEEKGVKLDCERQLLLKSFTP